MSEPLRVALVAEGPTDGVVIRAALRAILGERLFVLTQIFPEGSITFGATGSGWVGVYKWCHQAVARGNGRLRNDALVFENYDLLLLHLDADVAGANYGQGSIQPLASDGPLQCERQCPPASDTTTALRSVLLSWCGEQAVPDRCVVCIPSKSTEAWVLASLFPTDHAVLQGIECHPDPASRLAQQPAANRIHKRRRDYLEQEDALKSAWPNIAGPGGLSEARRFQTEFLAMLPNP